MSQINEKTGAFNGLTWLLKTNNETRLLIFKLSKVSAEMFSLKCTHSRKTNEESIRRTHARGVALEGTCYMNQEGKT